MAGGIYPTPKRLIAIEDYTNMYGTNFWNHNRRSEIIAKAKTLCEIIKVRKVDTKVFLECEEILEYFSRQYFLTRLDATSIYSVTRKPASMLAKYISWLCAQYEFLWNDSAISTYEREEILKTTLGRALWAGHCFVSQSETTPKTRTATPRVATTGTSGQPKNPFKARGGLSSTAVDLISTPGQKEYLVLPVFTINGVDSTGKVLEDTVYIRPVEDNAASQAKYTVNGTNKVLFGKAKGYGYCQVYFNDHTAATNFAAKVLNSVTLGGGIATIQVCKLKKTLANGYFQIGTEFGPVYVSASKLNENLEEDAQRDLVEDNKAKLSNRERWERFENAFYHEV